MQLRFLPIAALVALLWTVGATAQTSSGVVSTLRTGGNIIVLRHGATFTDQADTNPYDLGYSRRKLLALASILAMRTPIVVLDEPTTGQDARGVARIQQIVAELAEAGRTIITISHDMRFVAESFERVIVMRAGQIILDGTPAEVFAEAAWPALATTYLEPPLPARVGANAGVGATPTEAVLVASLAALGNASAIDAPNVDTPNADGRNG